MRAPGNRSSRSRRGEDAAHPQSPLSRRPNGTFALGLLTTPCPRAVRAITGHFVALRAHHPRSRGARRDRIGPTSGRRLNRCGSGRHRFPCPGAVNARWRPDRQERCRTGRSPVSCESAAAARAIFDSHPAWRGGRSKLGSGHPFSGRCGQRTSFDHHHEHVHLWPSEPRGAFGQSSPRPPRHADGTEQLPGGSRHDGLPTPGLGGRERELRVSATSATSVDRAPRDRRAPRSSRSRETVVAANTPQME